MKFMPQPSGHLKTFKRSWCGFLLSSGDLMFLYIMLSSAKILILDVISLVMSLIKRRNNTRPLEFFRLRYESLTPQIPTINCSLHFGYFLSFRLILSFLHHARWLRHLYLFGTGLFIAVYKSHLIRLWSQFCSLWRIWWGCYLISIYFDQNHLHK